MIGIIYILVVWLSLLVLVVIFVAVAVYSCIYLHQHVCMYNTLTQIHLPLIHVLCNPGLRDRHWEKINSIVGDGISLDPSENLRTMLGFKLEPYMEQIDTVSSAASKEYSLERAMQQMEEDWDTIVFSTTLYRDTGTYSYIYATPHWNAWLCAVP